METNERDKIIAMLLADGHGLSDVQRILESEHDVKLTYMELRLIASDLSVNWEKIDVANAGKDADTIPDLSKLPEDDDDDENPGGTRVSISKIVRPGAVISGDVTFQSGVKAEWYLDQMGRLGLTPEEGSAKPSEEDLIEFQQKLQEEIQSSGM